MFHVHSRLCGWSYLIYFVIGNLSYSPSSELSHTVLFLDVLYTTDPHHRSKSYSTPCAAPFNLFLHGTNTGVKSRVTRPDWQKIRSPHLLAFKSHNLVPLRSAGTSYHVGLRQTLHKSADLGWLTIRQQKKHHQIQFHQRPNRKWWR